MQTLDIIDKLLHDSLSTIGKILVKRAKKNMIKISYGRRYIINGRVHIASKAGDTANNMSGALSRTIRYKTMGNIMEFGAGNKKINYAKFLELGTKKMDKRPNYHKTLLQAKPQIERELLRAFREAIRHVK